LFSELGIHSSSSFGKDEDTAVCNVRKLYSYFIPSSRKEELVYGLAAEMHISLRIINKKRLLESVCVVSL
jgi:hypothetical protein